MSGGIAVTLEQILDAREKRAEKQKELVRRFRLPVVSFTVNIPGPYKKTALSRSIFQQGYIALINALYEKRCFPVCSEAYKPDTGYEALIVVNMEENALKELTVQIEDKHSLGRLFDFDVISSDGDAVSREKLGYSRRKCLLCGEDAHACGRSRRHTTEELLKKIEYMVRLSNYASGL